MDSRINKAAIIEIAHKSKTATNLFRYFKTRERSARNNVSYLSQLKQYMDDGGFHAVPTELKAAFQELAAAGVGELKGDTFKWNYGLRELSEIAIDERVVVGLTRSEPSILKEPAKQTVIFMMGDRAPIRIELPQDFSPKDVKYLSDALAKLAS